MAAAGEAVWADLVAHARTDARPRTVVVLGAPDTGTETLVDSMVGARTPSAHGALAYTCADLGALDAPDVPRRPTHVYTVHGADAAVSEVLPYFFPPVHDGRAALARVADALFVVVLDWRAPWTFAAQLVHKLQLVRRLLHRATAPEADTQRAAMQAARATALGGAPDAPLAPGLLLENVGVPLVIAFTHADALPALVRDRRVSEAQLDTAQQVVRTIGARYGAALVSTSPARASSFATLREVLCHALFDTPCVFEAAPNDAGTLLVPPGWDSWSKIAVLNESFACDALNDAWEKALQTNDAAFVQRYHAWLPPPTDEVGGAADLTQTPREPSVAVPDWAAFLTQLYAQQQAGSGGEAPAAPLPPSAPHNVLGPAVGASTLDLPAVEQALAEQGRTADTPRRPRIGAVPPPSAPEHTPAVTTPKQTEVLHSFFQSPVESGRGAQHA